MKTILVVGGAGFIGSELVKRYLNIDGHEVYSLDDYSSGSASNHHEGATYINGHSKDIEDCIDFVPNIVFHLGEYSRVEQSFSDFEKVWESNILGTKKVLEFCARTGAKLVYAGSSTKFGDEGLGRNQSPYGWTKASNTDLIMNYGDWYGLDFAICYFYNAYGDNEISSGQYATVIGIFRESIKNTGVVQIVAPGTQRRNFTHVFDIVEGLLLVGEQGRGDGYGIGHPNSYSIIEVASLFGAQIEWLPPRKGNRMGAPVITDKIRALGWEPQFDLPTYISNSNHQCP